MLFSTFSIAQFKFGTISAGALFHYSRSMENDGNSNGDYDMLGMGSQYTIYSAKPAINYFIFPFLSLDVTFDYTSTKNVDDKYGNISLGMGFGTSYYTKQNIYIGGGVFNYKTKYDDYTTTKSYHNIYGGFLVPFNHHVFLNLNCSYLMGLTKEYNSTYSSYSMGINETIFAFNVGIKTFF